MLRFLGLFLRLFLTVLRRLLRLLTCLHRALLRAFFVPISTVFFVVVATTDVAVLLHVFVFVFHNYFNLKKRVFAFSSTLFSKLSLS